MVETDQGQGYLKAMGGDPSGPHTLACEWIGTQLAHRLGLQTLDFALVHIDEDDEIPLSGGEFARPGPAFITRKEKGGPWGGDVRKLSRLANAEEIALLVVFDTWTLNCDRCLPPRINRDNVFLSREGAPVGRLVLKAIDHTHCFTCGRDLSRHVAGIGHVKDQRVYGLFPEFETFMRLSSEEEHSQKRMIKRAAHELASIKEEEVATMVHSIPGEWQVDRGVQEALVELICRRASYMHRIACKAIADRIWPQQELFDL